MKQIFAVKDLAVQAFGMPFFVRSKGEAMRSFIDEVNNKGQQNSAIAAHPDDYELYSIGEYEEDAGTITAKIPELIARAKELVTKE